MHRLGQKALRIFVISTAAFAAGQTPENAPKFETAVVRISRGARTPEGYSFSDQKIISPGRFQAVNSNLSELIRWAYQLEEYQLSAPGWATGNTVTFDIVATAPPETSSANTRLMLRSLLAERLGLQCHFETRTVSAYELVVDKGGPKLQKAAVDSPRIISFGHGNIKTIGTTMARFAAGLSRELHHPVLDRTGIAGVFAIDYYVHAANSKTVIHLRCSLQFTSWGSGSLVSMHP